jgi:hypothetical protein
VEVELMSEKFMLDISGAIDAAATHEGGSHGVG